ncbi:hypothetical protein KO317_01100 [Candidatus Micrarchaeota archaeon]|jgi:hypothetical protein|nr:hypothetical protein [Candidatus Micrarchaeota archaeon]
MDRNEILKTEEICIEIMKTGIKQRITFRIIRENTPIGKIPFLTTEKFIDLQELIKISEKYQLPLKAKNGKIFPKGKMAKDFIGL